MTKRLFFVLGVVIGIVVAEIFRRKKMALLHELETKQAREKARFAKYDRQWHYLFSLLVEKASLSVMMR